MNAQTIPVAPAGQPATTFAELRKLNVNEYIEKKNNLAYLSWAWAVDQLLQRDPMATWSYPDEKRYGDTLMVFCSVTAFGKSMTAQLPVMDHRNKSIVNPDAFAVNVAMQRCLAKAIALHGIGLYIYAGEDMPDVDISPKGEEAPATEPVTMDAVIKQLAKVDDIKEFQFIRKGAARELWSTSNASGKKRIEAAVAKAEERLKPVQH
jgi:hypothetical protein